MKNLGYAEKARKVAITIVAAALAAAFGYGIAGVAAGGHSGFGLTAARGFTITSKVYAATCTGTPDAKLFPGSTRCLAVTIHDPLSVAIDVTALSVGAPSFTPTPSNPHTTPPCTPSMLRVSSLFSHPFPVSAAATTTVDAQIRLETTPATQDACGGGTFDFTFSGSATYTDTTTTALTSSLTGTTVSLKAAVRPANPTSDPYGPSSTSATVHHVTFYGCGTTPSCTSKTALGTVPLTTGTPATKVATATFDVRGLTPGTYFYEARYPATGAHTGTFAGSSSAIESVTVTSPSPHVRSGLAFTSAPTSGSTGSGTTGALAFTGSDTAAVTAAGVVLLAAGGILVVWERRRRRSSTTPGGTP